MLRSLTPVYGATSSGVAFANSCNLINLQGYKIGATDKWLQIFDSSAVPANNAVPLKSYQLPGQLAYSWKFDPGELVLKNGLYVCVSDTEATKTLSADTADFFIDIEEYEIQPKGTTTTGDLTTGRDALTVWSSATGPKKVVRLDWTNNEAVPTYLMLFSKSANADGSTPLLTLGPLAAGASMPVSFGDGLEVRQYATDGTLTKGCTFMQSTTAGTLTATAGALSYIRATRKEIGV